MRRYDVSAVPSQGGYLAKRCPVRAQNEVIVPAVPAPAPPELQRRLDRGRQFEQHLIRQLVEGNPGAALVGGTTIAEAEWATAAAMAQGAPLIIGGRLPTDEVGRRVGKPDILVATTEGAYRPVDIKNHLTLDPMLGERRGLPGLISPLHAPSRENAATNEAVQPRKREEDLLQLAHYQRMLEAAGLAPEDRRWAGIIGVERCVVWYDLDAPIWKTPSSSGRQKWRSTMDVYDFEFDFRLDVMAVAAAHQRNVSVELLVAPVRVAECAECPWWDYCREHLEAGAGDVSLLPRIGWREWKIHHDRGVHDREALARLDVQTARLVSAGIDIPEFQRLVEGLPDETPVRDLGVVVRAKSQLARLEGEGVLTFGDVMRLDSHTASYAGAGLSWLPEQIDLARAALGPNPIYRRRGIDKVVVPRADVEVDVDMENVEDGVYLWGALHTQCGQGARTSMYHAHVTWEPLTPDSEAQNFLRFWAWLMQVRREASRRHQTFRSYCYNASAENTYLRKLGLVLGILDEVTAFIRSEEWVDLLRVVNDQLITGGSTGLKAVAPMAGFAWDVEDPGGGLSMVRYDVAVGTQDTLDRQEARAWLLTYNRGDVGATLAIRDWLEEQGASLPSVTALEPPHRAVAAPIQAEGSR